MSLRKGISLLLLAVFTFTSVVPAFAAINFSVSNKPTIVQDLGLKSEGANLDVIPLGLTITADNTSVLFGLGNGGTTQINKLYVGDDGVLSSLNGDYTDPRVAILVPPTGTKFVKLPGYKDISGSPVVATNTLSVNGEATTSGLVNLEVKEFGNFFPNAAADQRGKDVITATVLTEDIAESLVGAGNQATYPAGSLILHFATQGSVLQSASTSQAQITIKNIGIAADPLGDTDLSAISNFEITYKPVSGSAGNALNAFNIAETKFQVANIGDRASLKKLEVVKMGTLTGNETGTASPEDDQSDVIVIGSDTTSVEIGPGLITAEGISAKLDIDAILIRAAEMPDDGTETAVNYFQTPFATSSFVTTAGEDVDNKVVLNGDHAALNVALSESNGFKNADNALIEVTFRLLDSNNQEISGSSDLLVKAASLTLVGAKEYAGYSVDRSAGAPSGRTGYLGALAADEILVNGAEATLTPGDWGFGVLYDGLAGDNSLVLKDLTSLDNEDIDNLIGSASPLGLVTVNGGASAVDLNPTEAGIFPGSIIVTSVIDSNFSTVDKAVGSGVTPFAFAETGDIVADDDVYSHGEVTARLLNTAEGAGLGDNAWFVITGSDNGADITGDSFMVAETNYSLQDYEFGFTGRLVEGAVDADKPNNFRNNAVMVARLDGKKLQILPLVNKYDALRDVIAIRPEATITVSNAITNSGAKLVADITGNNIPANTRIVFGEIVSSTGFDVGLELSDNALPVHGNLASPALIKHAGSSATENRAALALSEVDGSTNKKSIEEALTPDNVLDEVMPPLFCGGTAGTNSKGPNGQVIQPKARAILIKESTEGAFQRIVNIGGDAVIRVKLPVGMDLNKFSATATDILDVGFTGGITGVTIPSWEGIKTGVTQAYVDLKISGLTSDDSKITDAVALYFKPNALVAPASLTSFQATVEVVKDQGSVGDLTDDVVMTTIGTVPLASACSTFLTVSYCPDAFSTYVKAGSAATQVEDTLLANDASKSTFGSAGSALRLIKTTPEVVSLPDICIEEGIADALPVGGVEEGVPSAFGTENATAAGQAVLHIAASRVQLDSAAAGIGLEIGSSPNVLLSDSSLNAAAPVDVGGGDDQNEVSITLSESTISGKKEPFEEKTRIRVRGLQMKAVDPASPFPPAQDLIVWVEVPSASNTHYVIGSSTPAGIRDVNTTTGEYFLSTVYGAEGDDMANLYVSKVPGSLDLTPMDWGDDDISAATNDLLVATSKVQLTKLANAVSPIVDDSGYSKLSIELKDRLTMFYDELEGSNLVEITVQGPSGLLEPGSLIKVSTSGAVTDSVTVPVTSAGAFVAKIKGQLGQQVVVEQFPSTQLLTASKQIIVFDEVANINVDPVLISASAKPYGSFTLPNRGKVPVIFTLVSSGKTDAGADYVPANVKVNGVDATLVTGTTNEYIALVKIQDDNIKVTATNGSETLDAVVLDKSALNISTEIKGKLPLISRVAELEFGLLGLTGKRLSKSDVTFGFLLDDGSFQAVTLAEKTAKGRTKQKSDVEATIPENAVYAVYVVDGRGSNSTTNFRTRD